MNDVAGGPDGWPVDPVLLGPGQVVVDLVYHPPLTPWLEASATRGATVMNGLGMLVHQAALLIERWTGLEAPVDAMWAAVADPSAG
jgi:shikimate dehydrogenase